MFLLLWDFSTKIQTIFVLKQPKINSFYTRHGSNLWMSSIILKTCHLGCFDNWLVCLTSTHGAWDSRVTRLIRSPIKCVRLETPQGRRMRNDWQVRPPCLTCLLWRVPELLSLLFLKILFVKRHMNTSILLGLNLQDWPPVLMYVALFNTFFITYTTLLKTRLTCFFYISNLIL